VTEYQNLVIEPLCSNHDRVGFQCGVDSLDNYLQRQANQDIKRRVSRVFVATKQDEPDSIVGYYTLSSLAIELNDLPDSLARKLPRHPIPAALIGRLAVSQQAQNYGVGKMLLVNAIQRTLSISNEIAIYAVVVDAINDEAECFYQKFGFSRTNSDRQRLFLPLKSF
jgi:GNAT superfamily N-acetyltransferase